MTSEALSGTARFLGTVILAAVVAATVAATRPLITAAQQQEQWSVDERVPGYLDDTFTPVMIADSNGTVHAFASQWVGDRDPQLAVVYRQWSLANGWTDPVDVLLSPSGDARVIDASLDQDSMIHVVFWGGDPSKAWIFHSMVPAAAAWQAQSWTTPQLVGTVPDYLASGALAGDGKDNLVLIYSGSREGNGVYATTSSDAGATWTDPYPVFLTYDPDLVPYSLDAVGGQDGRVHAVWNVVTSTGMDMSIHYSGFDIESQRWSVPIMLDKRIDELFFFGPSYPRIVNTGKDLVILYNSGNPVAGGPVDRGRPIMLARMSSDGGTTWSDAVSPFAQHVGRSGEHALVVDSNQVAYAIAVQRIESTESGTYTIEGGIWYNALHGNRWGEPRRFTTQLVPHSLKAVVSQGNVLLVAWREDPGQGEHGVWNSYTTLDAPRLELVPLPTVRPTATATMIPTPTPAAETAIRTVPAPSQITVGKQANALSGMLSGPIGLLVSASVPVLLVLAGITLIQLRPHSGR